MKDIKTVKTKIRRLAFCILALSLLAGCDVSFFSPQDTVRAPKPTGFFQGIQQALEAAVGSDIILKYPSTGSTRSAFSVNDIDKDGVAEVLAFYQLRAEGEVTRMNLLCYRDDRWVSVQDFSPVGNDLVKIEYTDLDGDGVDEVIAGWSVSTSKSNQLVVYGYQKGLLVQRASENYTGYVLCDIDNNAKQELGIVQLDKTNKTAKMNFYSFTSDKITVLGSVALDGNVTSYAGISTGRIGDGITAVYLDGYKDTNTMITELVYYDGAKLVNPFYDAEQSLNTVTLRYQQFFCTDIDNNGIIDIPFSKEMFGYSGALASEKQYFIKWQYFDGGALNETYTAWYSRDMGYYIDFNSEWEQKVTVAVDKEKNSALFSLWNSETGMKDEHLFTIRRFGAGEWETKPLTGYSAMYATGEYVWAVSFSETANAEFQIDITKLMQKFHLISS